MKKVLLVVTAVAVFLPFPCYARGPQLKSLHIHSVYIYSSLVHLDDATAQEEISWLRKAVPQVLGWKLADSPEAADAILITVPHGADYESGVSSTCYSVGGVLNCANGDGSSIHVSCSDLGCDSWYDPGNYLSLSLAVPSGDPSLHQESVVWRSGHDDALSRDQETQSNLSKLCHNSGIAGGRKCWSMTSRSWKSFIHSKRQKQGVFTLPQ